MTSETPTVVQPESNEATASPPVQSSNNQPSADNNNSNSTAKTEENNHANNSTSKLPPKIPVVKGTPKSGRKWKSTQTKRASSVKVGKAFRQTWEQKMKKKQEYLQMKERERKYQAALEAKQQAEKERLQRRRKAREENAKKSSVVQVIKDTRKIKKMSKKQLLLLEKR